MRKGPHSPGEFLTVNQRFLQLMYYENHKVDIDGQLAAGQYTSAALLTKMALERGVLIFLLAAGEAGATLPNVWAMFARATSDIDIYDRAVALLHVNPADEADVRAHAAAVIDFVESTLEVHGAGYESRESFAEYGRNVEGIDQLLRLVRV